MVMCVGIRRLGELVWVVAMHVSQGCWCWWWLNGCSVSGPCAESWQIEDNGDRDQAADGTRKRWPPQPMSTQPLLLPLMEPRTGVWWRMERHDGRFVTFDGTSRGERGHGLDRRERGEGRAPARSVEMGRGVVCGCLVVQCCKVMFWGLRWSKWLKWGDWGWEGLGSVWWSYLEAAVSRTNCRLSCLLLWYLVIEWKRMLLTFNTVFLRCFGETWRGEAQRCWTWVSRWRNTMDEHLHDWWVI